MYSLTKQKQFCEQKLSLSPRAITFQQNHSKGKVMLEVFFDFQGIVHHEFISDVATVKEFAHLQEAICLNCLEV
jgi:hypothetical protein